LEASDDAGVARMCIDTRGQDCRSWVAYSPTYTTSIYSRETEAQVRVWFEDAWGNRTAAPVVDSIKIDQTRPTDGTLRTRVRGSDVELSWSGFSDGDEGSGIVSYTVRSRAGRTASNCRTGDLVYEGSDTELTVSGLASASSYGFIVCANDAAGNSSRGVGELVTTR
ncbi:MAG: fibronectin type III domain-containing protein, partial [Myxococcota bacterium]